eukprot:TRINITY_DN52339_c0_g1_i1.p1 TRINITY_DN52339_c0_g1~~TRINITY_DN52339_c0_g1_i1.p1  ORF type:complete len:188 (+),score=27.40 TRINITY_DN52339_c0_g1_i1:70-633(+)
MDWITECCSSRGAKEVEDEEQVVNVTIVRASGLKSMNVLGDSPYCTCQVTSSDGHPSGKRFKTKTKPNTLNPEWNESFTLNNFSPGNSIELTVYNQGALIARTEGKVLLKSDEFWPHGLEEDIAIPGVPGAMLTVSIVKTEKRLVPPPVSTAVPQSDLTNGHMKSTEEPTNKPERTDPEPTDDPPKQ